MKHKNKKTKIIFLTGGVFSSVGKGLTLANLGRIFKELGFKVSALKLDPYLNIDSGSLSPIQHGEVYVTSDGHETDLDLGHYERFLDCEISRFSCITAGTIYKRLLSRNSDDSFSGETIQVFPHLIDEIHAAIYDLLNLESDLDLLFVEIGGTVGDLEHLPFIEAACSFKYKYGRENVLFIHISPIFYQKISHEYKTKPTQHSIRVLSNHNVFPDILILRSDNPIPHSIKEKLNKTTLINEEDIFVCLDKKNIYLIAEDLYEEKIHHKILQKLNLPPSNGNLDDWRKKTQKILAEKKHKAKMAIIGKYISNFDSYMSIVESLKIASYELSLDLNIDYLDVETISDLSQLEQYGAICVPYGFGKRGTEEKMKIIEYCRIHKIPFLGICFGMQLAWIEYARNELKKMNANSIEIDPKTDFPLFILCHGGKMRLGKHSIEIVSGTNAHKLFGTNLISSRHRHRYSFNSAFLDLFNGTDLVVSGFSADEQKIPEIIELKNHPFFMATQFHPEFETTFSKVSPIFIHFLQACINRG